MPISHTGYRTAPTLFWALCLPALAACGQPAAQGDLPARAPASAPAAAPAPPQGPLVRGEFVREMLMTGELEAVRSIAIKAPQTAIFQMRLQFMAEEGAVVKAGDPLVSFDNSALAAQVHDLENAILDAETQIVAKRSELASALKDLEIELAEKRYEHDRTRLEASIDPEVVSRKVYSERQLAYTSAERELRETQERIDLTRKRGEAEVDVLVINRDKLRKDLLSAQQGLALLTINAPSEGLVVYEMREGTTLRYQEGDSCWPGQGVMRLPDLSEMQVVFFVNEVDAPMLSEGMRVRVALDAFAGRELTGTIRQVPSMAVKRGEESKIAVFKVTASLDETWVGEMKPGMSVRGTVVVDRREDAPLVARDAVRFDGARHWLMGDPEKGRPDAAFTPLASNARYYLVSEEEMGKLQGEGS
ncbi:MAG TPA: efflux RND transporter periplasmic adaptor subunit [Candidatus Polarisedimenticolia bacterium]|nr:efflux RND transporter periplasmic adaptor subunit [Candidatus Polarisedimenticolia bacterium]